MGRRDVQPVAFRVAPARRHLVVDARGALILAAVPRVHGRGAIRHGSALPIPRIPRAAGARPPGQIRVNTREIVSDVLNQLPERLRGLRGQRPRKPSRRSDVPSGGTLDTSTHRPRLPRRGPAPGGPPLTEPPPEGDNSAGTANRTARPAPPSRSGSCCQQPRSRRCDKRAGDRDAASGAPHPNNNPDTGRTRAPDGTAGRRRRPAGPLPNDRGKTRRPTGRRTRFLSPDLSSTHLWEYMCSVSQPSRNRRRHQRHAGTAGEGAAEGTRTLAGDACENGGHLPEPDIPHREQQVPTVPQDRHGDRAGTRHIAGFRNRRGRRHAAVDDPPE